MTAEQLVDERARSLLELVRDKGLRISIPNLEGTARRTWGKLSEEEITAVANLAWKLAQLGRVEGEPSPDWPTRTVKKAPPPAAASPAVPPVPRINGTQEVKPMSMAKLVRAEIRRLLEQDPKLRAKELFDRLTEEGVDLCAWTSFSGIHVPAVRAEMGISMVGKRGKADGAAAPESVPESAPPAAKKPAGPAAPVLSAYPAFVVRTLAEVCGATEADVLDRIVLHWATDHQPYLTGAGANIGAFRDRRTAA
ncbi:MAG: hypothetical protein AB7I13_00120 [Vicinamibacterales bacterium]